MKALLTVFVKTPALSRVKTRLAATIGRDAAEEFYRLSCQAVLASVVQAQQNLGDKLRACWAVAEPEAEGWWPTLPVVAQGQGGLGERLAQVYEYSLNQTDAAIMLGADAPLVSAEDIGQAWAAVKATGMAMGLAEDGGFWCFAGRQRLPRALWQQVSYSTDNTAKQLMSALAPYGQPQLLGVHRDVDTAEDLPHLLSALDRAQVLNPAQQQLARWLRAQGTRAGQG